MDIDLTENKSFCPFAFKGAIVTVDNSVKFCCRYQSKSPPKVTKERSLSDIFYNSIFYNDVRAKMLAGEKIEGCKRCYNEEEAGYNSLRIGNVIPSTSTEIDLEYLEVESGRHCNLKCRMCGPDISTGWNEDLENDPSLNKNNRMTRLTDLTLYHYNESLEHLTKEECSKLTVIKATGGEPFLSKTFLSFIDNLDNWGLAKNIYLKVYSNTSFLPKKKFIDSLLRFKNFNLMMSLDDVGPRNDYIRSGSNWKTVERVADFWFKLASENKDKVFLYFSTTVGILNILTFHQLWNWADLKEKEFNITIWRTTSIIHWPYYLAFYNFPRHIKNKLLESKTGFKTITPMIENVYKILNSHKSSTISAKRDFIDATSRLDSIRNEDWKRTFPELFKLISG